MSMNTNQQPLTVCCHRLGGIALYTLRQWCEKAGIDLEQQKSLADPRQKWLTGEQLEQLAQAHGRVLDQPKLEPEPIPPNAYKLLIEQTAQAARQAEQIRADHAKLQEQAQGIVALLDAMKQEQATLHMQLDTLRTQELEALRQESAAQLAAIQREQTEQRASTAKHFESVLEIQKLARTEQERIDDRQQEQQHRMDALLTDHQRKQEEARTDLDRLTTASQQEQQHLERLTAWIEALQDETRHSAQATQEHLERAQKEMQEQLQQALRGIQAEFRAALAVSQKEMQATIERKARELAAVVQSAEQDEARDIAVLTAQQEQLQTQVKNATTHAEAATSTALGGQRRIDGVEQQLVALDKRLQQAEQEAHERAATSATPQPGDQEQVATGLRRRGRQKVQPPASEPTSGQ